jgi:hypothetical protein
MVLDEGAPLRPLLLGQLVRDPTSRLLFVRYPRQQPLALQNVFEMREQVEVEGTIGGGVSTVRGVVAPLWPAVDARTGVVHAPLVHVSVAPLRFRDGSTAVGIGIQVHHAIMDGRAFFTWVRHFAHAVRTGSRVEGWTPSYDRALIGVPTATGGAASGELPPPPPLFGAGIVAVVPNVDQPPSPLDDLPDEQKVAAIASMAPPSTMVCTTLHTRDIEVWRSHLGMADATTNTVVCAVLWHAMWASLPTPTSQPTSRFALAVDVRRHSPALAGDSVDYAGNASLVIGVDADTAVAMSSVPTLARRIAELTSSVTAAASGRAAEWLSEAAAARQSIITPFMTGPMGMGPDIGVSNWTRLGAYDVDFGTRLVYAGPDAASTLPGIAILLPAPQDGDGVTVYACIHNSGIGTFRRSLVPQTTHSP